MEEIISFVVVLEIWAKPPSRFATCDSFIFKLPWADTPGVHPTYVAKRRIIRAQDPERTNLLFIIYRIINAI